jgi:hypothetical protein
MSSWLRLSRDFCGLGAEFAFQRRDRRHEEVCSASWHDEVYWFLERGPNVACRVVRDRFIRGTGLRLSIRIGVLTDDRIESDRDLGAIWMLLFQRRGRDECLCCLPIFPGQTRTD